MTKWPGTSCLRPARWPVSGRAQIPPWLGHVTIYIQNANLGPPSRDICHIKRMDQIMLSWWLMHSEICFCIVLQRNNDFINLWYTLNRNDILSLLFLVRKMFILRREWHFVISVSVINTTGIFLLKGKVSHFGSGWTCEAGPLVIHVSHCQTLEVM